MSSLTTKSNASGHRIIRMKEMLTITALSRATAFRLIASDKHFPQPIKMGQGTNSATGFLLSEIESWIDHKISTDANTTTDQQRKRSRLLRRKHVEEKTSLSRACIYAFMKKGRFPNPIHLSNNTVAWLETEIDEWINQCIEERNK